MAKGVCSDKLSMMMRKRAIILEQKRVLIANFLGSDQERDIAGGINCKGFGRKRTISVTPPPRWTGVPERIAPAAIRLGISPEEASICQVFQVPVCNFRCWFCYVPDDMRQGECQAGYFRADELLGKLLMDSSPPRLLVLSGGEPNLIPEWLPWMLDNLIKRGLEKYFYVWWDTNLSTYFPWKYLSSGQWELVRYSPNLGVQATIKGITSIGFSENSRVQSKYFDRQFDVLAKLVNSKLDVYINLTLTLSSLDNIQEDMGRFVDRLQRIHPNLPLRTNPVEIKVYTPTRSRLSPERRQMLNNQYIALQVWLTELRNRFSNKELSTPQPFVSLD